MARGKTESADSAHWTDVETDAMLDKLLELKSDGQSGNGWKPAVWTAVVDAVQAADPDATPVKDKQIVQNKLSYVRVSVHLTARPGAYYIHSLKPSSRTMSRT